MSVRALLSGLPVLARKLPRFSTDDVPPVPDDLFVAWLTEAVAAAVAEPHAMTLSTVDADGLPDTRVVLLRDIGERGWQFTADATSAKGRQLTHAGVAALGFYWREQGRQVRVRGAVAPLDRETADRDFLARPAGSRAASLAGTQSEILPDPAELDAAFTAAAEAVRADPSMTSKAHTVYAVTPASVEFWQGDPQRRHVRLRYRRTGDAWARELLWP